MMYKLDHREIRVRFPSWAKILSSRNGVLIPVVGKYISLLPSVQIGFGSHPDSYRVENFSPRIKQPEREAYHSHLMLRVSISEANLHSLLPLHGVVIN
jgi:hypothetical protein